jgi:hydrogenase maturation protein HypF
MADLGLEGEVLGVAFDGTGLGEDGTIWGGEFLVGGAARVERAAHLRAVPLPGGDAAARQPFRMALSHLRDASIDFPSFADRLEEAQIPWRGVMEMIDKRVAAPLTSSAGRLFDAVAALLGLRWRASYEGQPAMELEWLCEGRTSVVSYPVELEGSTVDTRPIVAGVVEDLRRGVDRAEIARRFHATMAALVVRTCESLRASRGTERVVLTGGVFQNVLLAECAERELTQKGFAVHRHRRVPPNDGGLSLGQLLVASARMET